MHGEGLRLPPNTDFTKYRKSRRPAATDEALPAVPDPPAGVCASHQLPACTNCDRLGKTPMACCTAGHHAVGHADRRPMTYKCDKHGLGPCAGCQLTHRGVRHCCERGHHDPTPAMHRQQEASLTTTNASHQEDQKSSFSLQDGQTGGEATAHASQITSNQANEEQATHPTGCPL